MKNLEEAEQDLLAEQRSQKMLNLMSYRLDEETNDVRAEAGDLSFLIVFEQTL